MSRDRRNGGMPARRAVVRWAVAPVPPRVAPARPDPLAADGRRRRRRGLHVRGVQPRAARPAAAEFGDGRPLLPVRATRRRDAAGEARRAQDVVRRHRCDRPRDVAGAGHGRPGRLPQRRTRTARSAADARLRSGRYPTADGEVAVTDWVAVDVRRRRSARRSTSTASTRTVVGIVENPSDLGDEFVLLPPSALGDVGRRHDAREGDASRGRVVPTARRRRARIVVSRRRPRGRASPRC